MRYLVMLLLLAAPLAHAAFTLDDDGKALTVLENGKTVLTYHYTLVPPPAGVDDKYRRACYIHPLYGLDGETLTEDFPKDHRHHRGVFWAWPNSAIGDKPIDVWEFKGVREIHEAWLAKEAGTDKAEIAAKNVWVYDDAPNDPQIRETIRFTVLPASDLGRAIDFDLIIENVSKADFTIRGAQTDNKGYGGFCFRPDSTRMPMSFSDANGAVPKDLLRDETPWADVSFPVEKGGAKLSGAAIFEHPKNPGYPFPGWILRHYGFLGASWPHTDPKTLKPGESFELRYRLYVHRGNAEAAKVKEAFAAYTAQAK